MQHLLQMCKYFHNLNLDMPKMPHTVEISFFFFFFFFLVSEIHYSNMFTDCTGGNEFGQMCSTLSLLLHALLGNNYVIICVEALEY